MPVTTRNDQRKKNNSSHDLAASTSAESQNHANLFSVLLTKGGQTLTSKVIHKIEMD